MHESVSNLLKKNNIQEHIDDNKQKVKDPVKIDSANHIPEQPSSHIEEEKKRDHQSRDHNHDQKSSQWPHLGCFDLKEIGKIKYDGGIIFKKDIFVNDDWHYGTVEGEWLDGVPHGICIVDNKSYRGVITFVHGKMIGP